MSDRKTPIVTGVSQGIGAGLVKAFPKEDYNVVATSRDVSRSLTASPRLALVDGDIGKQETAAKAVEAAIRHFGTVDGVIASRGGIPLIDEGTIIGAIGCSGGTDSQDEISSKAGAAVIDQLQATNK
jgi:NAD(P)-dependent dehydrogenase (short-subunit alcohol dehydrogenase family)